jgi:hypothetical protein
MLERSRRGAVKLATHLSHDCRGRRILDLVVDTEGRCSAWVDPLYGIHECWDILWCNICVTYDLRVVDTSDVELILLREAVVITSIPSVGCERSPLRSMVAQVATEHGVAMDF